MQNYILYGGRQQQSLSRLDDAMFCLVDEKMKTRLLMKNRHNNNFSLLFVVRFSSYALRVLGRGYNKLFRFIIHVHRSLIEATPRSENKTL